MQRPGSGDERETDETFWNSLIPPVKRNKTSKKEKKKKKLKRKKERVRDEKKTESCDGPGLTQPEQSRATEDDQPKTKKKKKVAFDLSPFYIYARHPEVLVPPKLSPVEKPQDTDSQFNSQDLFITQKTISVSPSLPTREEVRTPPLVRPRPDKARNRVKSPRRPQYCRAATQTENFYTAELAGVLRFQQSRRPASGDLQPLDLSLPHRIRSRLAQSGAGERRLLEDSTSSNESQKVSSDDSESTARNGRPDLSQVRAVQMRLNESFYFKAKGKSHPARSESPLMKLSQGRDGKKTRKKASTQPSS